MLAGKEHEWNEEKYDWKGDELWWWGGEEKILTAFERTLR
jgi:hypothetical protein